MLKTNIDLLRKFDPKLLQILDNEDEIKGSIKVIVSKNGLPTLQVLQDDRHVFLHSKYNPIQEAEKIISNLDNIDNYDHVFFYGLGLGYHVEALLNIYPNKRFTFFEPSVEVFQLFLKHRDLKKIPLQQLSFIKVGLSKEETKAFVKEFFNFIQEKTLLITLPSYERFIFEQFNDFVQDFKKIVEEKRSALITSFSFQKRWTLNSWINLSQTINTPNVLLDINKDVFKNKPAILVSAGPSLNEEIENLRYIKENGLAYIFSVSSAINTLIDSDILPDAMCTYDPTIANQIVFEKLINKDIDTIPMIYGTSVGFETLKKYHGPKLHMVTSQDTISNFYLKRQDGSNIYKINDAPSIAVITLQLLYNLGCNPIILVGQNFAYKNNHFYSKGMEHKVSTTLLSNEQIKNAIKVKDVEGKEILTNELFNLMRSQFEYYLLEVIKSTDVINTTKGGAHINGTTFIELSTLINEKLKHVQIEKEWLKNQQNLYEIKYIEQQQLIMESELVTLNEVLRNVKKTLNNMDILIIEKKVNRLKKMFNKLDVEMKKFVKNDFYLTFLQPMSRVEFDLLTNDVNSLKFDHDTISKAKKTIKGFKRFVNSCEFDLINMMPIFEEINKEIKTIMKDRVKDVKDGK